MIFIILYCTCIFLQTRIYLNVARFTIKHSGSSASTNQKKQNGSDLHTRKYGHHGNRTQAWQPTQNKHPTMPQWMYRHHPREGKAIRPEFVGFGVGLKSEKRKQIKGGFPLMRSVPSSK
ncbi:uncharacterized protein LOC123562422 isoform X2 [Mercenaria mercenaria]|uniref:uncharacterized protein LOC123562422 isoform X2 n=1 Tax=Mercenaria mercenaria TaxID=6596 RepID=UPI00234F3F06|nr:uncharacterized protein LOC123562422 isoform X2 [Mercenaria mercenaria]